MRPRITNPATVMTTIGVVVIVAVAAVVWQHLPTITDIQGPFDVHGNAGSPVTGRDVSATVTGVRVSPLVDSTKPAGTWVVVDTELEGIRSTELAHGELIVGPNTYEPSSDVDILKTPSNLISPGITQKGSFVFDVASDLVAPASSAPLTLRIWVGDQRLDSRLVIALPTSGSRFSRVDSVVLDKPAMSVS